MAETSKNIVLGFVGENAHDILLTMTQCSHDFLKKVGLRPYLIDLKDPGCFRKIDELVNEHRNRILFGYGLQGVGSNLRVDERTLWERLRVPFFAHHGDNPVYAPPHHRNGWTGCINAYSVRDFLEAQLTYIKAPQPAFLAERWAYPTNPHATDVAWPERPIRLLFVKKGPGTYDLDRLFDALPVFLRKAALQACEEGFGNRTRSVTTLLSDVLQQHGIELASLEMFRQIAMLVDQHIRGARSNHLVDKVLRHMEVDLFGDGWEHLDLTGSPLRLHGTIHSSKLNELYARSQYIFNTMPNVVHGLHERVVAAMMAGAVCISSENVTTRQTLSAFPTFAGFEWDGSDIRESIQTALERTPPHVEDMTATRHRIEADFSPEAFWQQNFDMIKYAQMLIETATST